MSPTLMRIVVPISLVLLLVAVSEAGLPTIHMEVTNRLSNNKKLALHCYERLGRDLGEFILPPGGQFNYDFLPRLVFKSSKYYCSVKWDGSNLKWFDVWSKGRDYKEGLLVKWSITEKKSCRFDHATGAYSVCVFWN
ncbi:unnamed protein product [Lathyrus oleraceus]